MISFVHLNEISHNKNFKFLEDKKFFKNIHHSGSQNVQCAEIKFYSTCAVLAYHYPNEFTDYEVFANNGKLLTKFSTFGYDESASIEPRESGLYVKKTFDNLKEFGNATHEFFTYDGNFHFQASSAKTLLKLIKNETKLTFLHSINSENQDL